MINVIIRGQVLSSGSYNSKKDNNLVYWTDIYEADSGNTVRVFGKNGSTFEKLAEVLWYVSVYNNNNGLYVKYLNEVN